MAYTLPQLKYDYNALEPHLDARTMEIHHTRHHQTYVTKLNTALESTPELAALPIETLLTQLDRVSPSQRTAVRNNAGGHANHSFFWDTLSLDGPKEPVGELAEAIDSSLGGFETFKKNFAQAAINRFGSGWAWLCRRAQDQTLCICSTANQDSPLMGNYVECPGIPLLGLDVWEHAYYLLYQNRRPDYVEAFWKVIDWNVINARFLACAP